jgi:hypothetical protein
MNSFDFARAEFMLEMLGACRKRCLVGADCIRPFSEEARGMGACNAPLQLEMGFSDRLLG